MLLVWIAGHVYGSGKLSNRKPKENNFLRNNGTLHLLQEMSDSKNCTWNWKWSSSWFRCSLQSDTTEEEGWLVVDVSLQAFCLFIHITELPWLPRFWLWCRRKLQFLTPSLRLSSLRITNEESGSGGKAGKIKIPLQIHLCIIWCDWFPLRCQFSFFILAADTGYKASQSEKKFSGMLPLLSSHGHVLMTC